MSFRSKVKEVRIQFCYTWQSVKGVKHIYHQKKKIIHVRTFCRC
jgi:hypothetical protein